MTPRHVGQRVLGSPGMFELVRLEWGGRWKAGIGAVSADIVERGEELLVRDNAHGVVSFGPEVSFEEITAQFWEYG